MDSELGNHRHASVLAKANRSAEDLFRIEVIESQHDTWLGDIHLTAPPHQGLVMGVSLVFTAAIVLFVFLGHYTRHTTAVGQLVPASGLLNVVATHGGVIDAVYARLGAAVRRGQPLLQIDNNLASTGREATSAIVITQLRVQQQKLRADLADQSRLTQDQTDMLHSKIAAFSAQRMQLTSQLALQRQSVQTLSTLLAKIGPLGRKGYVSALEIQRQKLADLNAETQLKALTEQYGVLTEQMLEARQQLDQLPWQAARQRHATENQLAQIKASLAQNEAQGTLVLRAPENGIVSSLVVKSGQSVTTGEALLSVVPDGARLQARLLVPSKSIGFLHLGEQVLLRYQAFPYQKFGLRRGRIVSISGSALDSAEAAALLGQTIKVPIYPVMVALQRQSIQAYGRRIKLRPGMTLSADVVLDRRRLVEWIFQPMLGLKQRLQAQSRS